MSAPVPVDADAGSGGGAGLFDAGLFREDRVAPRRCGDLAGVAVAPGRRAAEPAS